MSSFGKALMQLRLGNKVRRAGWNGKGMFLKYIGTGEYSIKVPVVQNTVLPLEPFIALKTAQDTLIPWVPSQADILAGDWEMANE